MPVGMFGRSGQMFPRRSFHDAIYEEDYGSETDDDCCRGRGFSAILCWFLSVIILIGLAASVILTVFFVLRSKSLMPRPGEDVSDSYPELHFHSIESTEASLEDVTRRRPSINKSSSISRTHTTSSVSVLRNSSKVQEGGFSLRDLFFERKKKEKTQEEVQRSKKEPISTLKPEHAGSINAPVSIPSATSPSDSDQGPQVLFTMSPTKGASTTLKPYRRNTIVTRFPSEPKSFSSSKPPKDDFYLGGNTSGHPLVPNSHQPPRKGQDEHVATEETFYKNHFEDNAEMQLKKMHMEEIPPHDEDEVTKPQGVFDSTESTIEPDDNLHSSDNVQDSTGPVDVLSKLIRNLQPKWEKEKHETTTIPTTLPASLTSGTVRFPESDEKYISDNTEQENDKSKDFKPSLSTETGSSRGGHPPIQIVDGPDLVKESKEKNHSILGFSGDNNEFIDVLVGSEDHSKSVTKDKDTGIVTSAIFPSWYDGDNSTLDGINPRSKNSSGGTLQVEDGLNEPKISSNQEMAEEEKAPTGFDLFFNLFSPSSPSRGPPPIPPPPPPRRISPMGPPPRRHVLRFPPPPGPHRGSFDPRFRPNPQHVPQGFNLPERNGGGLGVKPTLPNGHENNEGRMDEAANAFHIKSPDGTTNIYGYYPSTDSVQTESNEPHLPDKQQSQENVNTLAVEKENIEEIKSVSKEKERVKFKKIPYDHSSEYLDSGLSGGGIRRPVEESNEIDNFDLNFAESGHHPVPSANSNKFSEESISKEATAPVSLKENMSEALEKPPEVSDFDDGGNLDWLPQEELNNLTESEWEELLDYVEQHENLNLDPFLGPFAQNKDTNSHEKSEESSNIIEKNPKVHHIYAQPHDTNLKVQQPSKNSFVTSTPPPGLSNKVTKEGFSPPDPVSFHENSYKYNQNSAHSSYHSKDGWKPVISAESSGNIESIERLRLSKPSSSMEYADYTALGGLSQRSELVAAPSSYSESVRIAPSAKNIVPSQRIPPPVPARIKFPEPSQNRPDFPDSHRTANKFNEPESGPGRSTTSNENGPIDRSKYMIRPAPPPIIMRRPPLRTTAYPAKRPNRREFIAQIQTPPYQGPQEFKRVRRPFIHPPYNQIHPRPRSQWSSDARPRSLKSFDSPTSGDG